MDPNHQPSVVPFWPGRRVLITGHTGFKGSWLSLWLQHLGAQVYGLALPPVSERGAYSAMRVHEVVQREYWTDIRDAQEVADCIQDAAPDLIFHLAAQSVVAIGYSDPVGTYSTNVLGTLHVLEGMKAAGTAHAAVIVTSDKVYRQDGATMLTEHHPLGHHDPYSNSKACTELLVDSWRQSYANDGDPALGTARAGNVIGGGDSLAGRLFPDILAHLEREVPIPLRNPGGVRPWQHVIEVLDGYMRLATSLTVESDCPSAVNFGPDTSGHVTVRHLVDLAVQKWGGGSWVATSGDMVETDVLRLDPTLARTHLGWRSHLSVEESVDFTIEWHRALTEAEDPRIVALSQIADYEQRPPHVLGS